MHLILDRHCTSCEFIIFSSKSINFSSKFIISSRKSVIFSAKSYPFPSGIYPPPPTFAHAYAGKKVKISRNHPKISRNHAEITLKSVESQQNINGTSIEKPCKSNRSHCIEELRRVRRSKLIYRFGSEFPLAEQPNSTFSMQISSRLMQVPPWQSSQIHHCLCKNNLCKFIIFYANFYANLITSNANSSFECRINAEFNAEFTLAEQLVEHWSRLSVEVSWAFLHSILSISQHFSAILSIWMQIHQLQCTKFINFKCKSLPQNSTGQPAGRLHKNHHYKYK